jgi:hypothetical protein
MVCLQILISWKVDKTNDGDWRKEVKGIEGVL